MPRKINKILDNLYLGNIDGACDVASLDRHRISAVVMLLQGSRPLTSDRYYLCIDAADSQQQSLFEYFPIANEFIHSNRQKGLSVLVHCNCGVSRSTTIVAAYLMALLKLTYAEAMRFLIVRRPSVNPNPQFRRQLKSYENYLRTTKADFFVDQKDVKFVKRQLARYDEEDSFSEEEDYRMPWTMSRFLFQARIYEPFDMKAYKRKFFRKNAFRCDTDSS